MDEVLWAGPVILDPNTATYRMMRGSLTYNSLCGIPVAGEIVKAKYLLDRDLYVPVVKLTRARGVERTETRLLANRREGAELMVQLVLAFLSVTQRYWVKYAPADRAEGTFGRIQASCTGGIR